ncbi:MAG: adenylate/guanylate cyclase domain-containing protein [Desulfobulbaceae bacterium]
MDSPIKKIGGHFLPAAGILVTLVIALLYVYQPRWVRILDQRLYDAVLRQKHGVATRDAVVVADLDEESLRRYGQWPWPRYRMALLLRKLQEAGVLAVGMDILFAETDRSSPVVLRDALQRDLGVNFSFSGLPEPLMDNDRIFADTLRDGPFVLGFFFEFSSGGATDEIVVKDLNPALVAGRDSSSPDEYLISAPALLQPLPVLAGAARATGFINTIRDPDGVLRSTPVIMAHKGKVYGNLGFVTLWTALGNPSLVLKYSAGGIESIRIGRTVVPLDGKGRLWLHYRGGSRTFPYLSAADILDGKVSPEQLRGKIVLMGTTAAGLRDLRTTPFGPEYPGVEAHATLIDTILTGDFIRLPDWLPGLEVSLTAGAGIVTTLLVCWVSGWYILPVLLLFTGACWYASLWLFAEYRFFFSPLFPIAAAGNFSLLSFLKFLRTDTEKRFIRKAFSRYVSSRVVDAIVAAPEKLSLEGEEREVSILFSDIRGFTTLSEKIPPARLSSLLKSYLTPMTRIIIDHSGTLDKFIGDAIMAFWNAPVEIPRHRQQAVAAGLAMIEALPSLNEMFEEEYGLRLRIGIGIHAGRASVGNMGSEDLFDYTVIGDNVNLTSRLEGLTKYYGVPLLVSEALADIEVDGYLAQELDRVTVKGKDEPVTLWTFRSLAELVPDELDRWERALRLYRSRSFREAAVILEELFREREARTYEIYLARCRDCLAQPPPPDWDHVHRHDSK